MVKLSFPTNLGHPKDLCFVFLALPFRSDKTLINYNSTELEGTKMLDMTDQMLCF